MSTLQDFLNANPIDNLTAEVVVSDRFKDKDGKIFKFKIKAMSNESFEETRKRSMKLRAGSKSTVELDLKEFNNSIVIENTIEPNFRDAASIQKLGCTTPEEYLNKVLLPGEIAELSNQIQQLSGFKSMDDLVEEAKN